MPKQLLAVVAGLVVAAAISFGLSYLLTSNGAEAGSSPWVVGGLIGVATMGVISNRAGRRKVAKVSGEARAAALAFTPPDGAGLLIVFREGLNASATGMDIAIDDRLISQLKGGQFAAATLPPGPHRLSAKLAGQANAASAPGTAEIDLAAGATVVIRLTVKMGLTTGTVVVTRIDDHAAAKAKLARMAMIAAA